MGNWNSLIGGLVGFGDSTNPTAASNSGSQYQQFYYWPPLSQQAEANSPFLSRDDLHNLYRHMGMRPASMVIRNQPKTNFDVYEQKHRAIVADVSEESEGMKEGLTGMLNTFLIGCDPEFAALNGNGTQINLSHHWHGDGEVGFDHGGRVGEFRPGATRGTYALTKKLQRLIKSSAIEKLQASKLRAGARVNQDCLGGHVHFGFPVNGTGFVEKVSALDRVTRVLETLDILPLAESAARRAGRGYGRWGDVRDSQGHTEYRTMASWLTDPKVAYLCLTAAKLAACDPKGTLENLPTTASFNTLIEWFRNYRSKDINARRALDRVLSQGHKSIQVYPDVDFRERWRELGL